MFHFYISASEMVATCGMNGEGLGLRGGSRTHLLPEGRGLADPRGFSTLLSTQGNSKN